MAKQGTSFEDYWRGLENRAKARGPRAFAEFERLGHRYRIGADLSALRIQKGLSQTEVATRAGIDQAEVSRIERGSTNATEDTLARIANALGADIAVVPRTLVNA